MEEKALQFIKKFLGWYQDSYSLPDVVNHIKLVDLVKEAEEIHTLRVKEKEKFTKAMEDYRKNVKGDLDDKQTKTLRKQVKKITRKRISRYL